MVFTDCKNLRELIDLRAKSDPHRPYLISAESDISVTFSELQNHAQSIEAYLDGVGVGPGQTAAFMMDNGCWTAVLMLGTMYAGRVVLPLNVVAGSEQLEYVIDHSDLKIIFCSGRYKKEFSNLLSQIDTEINIIQCSEDTGISDFDAAQFARQGEETAIDESETALMIYTSGTTGKPKGVLLSHQNIISGGTNTMIAHNLGPEDRSLCVLPLYHINAEMVSIMATLVSGSSVVISHRLSISKFWSWILDHGCTWFSAVPTVFSYLIDHHQPASNPEYDVQAICAQLRFARSASATLPLATHETFETIFGIPIIETMGISECSGPILSNPINRAECKPGSTGIPFGNEVRIVDGQHIEVSPNTRGEIAVRGDNVMKGYYKNPGETEKALDSDGWFYTGDLGHMDEQGFVFITGRMKELIIRGGENIAPGEIDQALYRHPSVLEAAAFGVEDDAYGEEVMAAVSLKSDKCCEPSELLAHCQKLLGPVKTPKQIFILDDLPKGPSGKIQRLKLKFLLQH